LKTQISSALGRTVPPRVDSCWIARLRAMPSKLILTALEQDGGKQAPVGTLDFFPHMYKTQISSALGSTVPPRVDSCWIARLRAQGPLKVFAFFLPLFQTTGCNKM
jgi:hypothetical protein